MRNKFFNFEFKQEILLSELIKLLMSKIVIIAITCISFACIFGFASKAFITPMYKSFTTMYIYTNIQSNQAGYISNSDLVAASNLAETYKYILTGNQTLESVKENAIENDSALKDKLTVKSLKKMVDVTTIDATQLIKIVVTSESPELSKLIADSYVNIANDEILQVFKAGGVEIVDSPELPKEPSSPNILKNSIIGFLLGGFLIVGLILLKYMADSTIYTTDDLKRISDLPILGTIPQIDVNENGAVASWTVVKERRAINEREKG